MYKKSWQKQSGGACFPPAAIGMWLLMGQSGRKRELTQDKNKKIMQKYLTHSNMKLI